MSWMIKADPTKKELGPLKTWSFSGLKAYEECPYRRFLQKVKGIREPSGAAASRGSEIHEMIEKYITGESDALPKIKEKPITFIKKMRELYMEGGLHVEENWCIDRQWGAVEYKSHWGIFIIDCYIVESETSAHIVDWKSGKSFGNELKHAEQLLMYACAAFARYPKLEYVKVSACYVDENKFGMERGFSRETVAQLRKRITERATAMTTATNFPPAPSKSACRWCKFKEMKDDNDKFICEWGVL